MNESPNSLWHACILYFCTTAALATACVALLYVIAQLANDSSWTLWATFGAPIVIIVLLPWCGLTYIFSSNRYPIQWHWLVSGIATLATTQCLRFLPTNIRPKITQPIGAACGQLSGESVELSTFGACASTIWSVLVQGAVLDATLAGIALFAASFTLKILKRKNAHK